MSIRDVAERALRAWGVDGARQRLDVGIAQATDARRFGEARWLQRVAERVGQLALQEVSA